MSQIRALVSDDHEEVRQDARRLIDAETDLTVCAFAANGPELVKQANRYRPDVIVGNLHLPEFDPAKRIRQLKKVLPAAELVIITAERDEHAVSQLFAAGVKSLLRKEEVSQFLIAATRAAAREKPFFTPTVADVLFARFIGKQPPDDDPDQSKLTSREREIIQLICDGKTNKAIAGALEISTRTVEVHRAAAMRKIGATSTADLVRYAIRTGLIQA